MALAALLEDEADLPLSPDGDEGMEEIAGVEMGLVLGQVSSSPGAPAVEACLLTNEEVLIPSELCLNADIFIDVMSLGWASLSDQERIGLLKCLPSFPEPENNDFQEKLTTLDGLFAGSEFHFGNPLKQFHASLNAGFYQPDVFRLREISRKLKFHAHLERQQRHAVSLLCELATSREQMLLDARCLPPNSLDNYRLHRRMGGMVDKKPIAVKKARSRYSKIMFEVRQESGWQDTSSSGEENDDALQNQFSDMALHGVMDEEMVVKNCLKARCKSLKKAVKEQISSSSPPPPPLELSDILERAEVKPASLTSGKVPKQQPLNGMSYLMNKQKKPGQRRSRLEVLKVQCNDYVRKMLTNPPVPIQPPQLMPSMMMMKNGPSITDMNGNNLPQPSNQSRSRPQSSVALTPTPPPGGPLDPVQTSPGSSQKDAPPTLSPALIAATQTGKMESFFHVIQGMLAASAESRATLTVMETLVKQWFAIAQSTNTTPSQASWSLRWINDRTNWHQELPSALRFLTGTFCPANYPPDFVPLVDMNDRSGHWVWLEEDMEMNLHSSQYLCHLYRCWIEAQSAERQIPPQTTPFHPDEQELLFFHDQERKRYSIPTEPFIYLLTMPIQRELTVGPVRISPSRVDTTQRTERKGSKDHTILTSDRPPAVTVLTLVRDAVARLASGEGTRTDICNLLRDSQYIRQDLTSHQLTNAVSGALDRLHSERDPCVRFDTNKKLWVYLHRGRSREDFVRIGQMLILAARRRQTKDASLASANVNSTGQLAVANPAVGNSVINGTPNASGSSVTNMSNVLPSQNIVKAPSSSSKANSRRGSSVNPSNIESGAGPNSMLQRKGSNVAPNGFPQIDMMQQAPVMLPPQMMQPQQLPSPHAPQPPQMFNGPQSSNQMIRGPMAPQQVQHMQLQQPSTRQPMIPAQNAPGMAQNWPPPQIAMQMQQLQQANHNQMMSGSIGQGPPQQPMLQQMHMASNPQMARHPAQPHPSQIHMMSPGSIGSGGMQQPGVSQQSNFPQYQPTQMAHHLPQMHHGIPQHMQPQQIAISQQHAGMMEQQQFYADHSQNAQQQQMLMYHHQQAQQQQQYRLVHQQVSSPSHHGPFQGQSGQPGPPVSSTSAQQMNMMQQHPAQFQSHSHAMQRCGVDLNNGVELNEEYDFAMEDNIEINALTESAKNLAIGKSSSRLSLSSTDGGNGVRRIIDVQVECDQVMKCLKADCDKSSKSCCNSKDCIPIHRTDSSDAMSSSMHSDKTEESTPFSKLIFNRPTQYLKWHVKPKTVLVMVKISEHNCESNLIDVFMDMAKFLIEERMLKVYAEEWLCRLVDCRDKELAEKLNAMPPVEPGENSNQGIPPCISELLCYESSTSPVDGLADIIDLIVCLGGDGTLLHVNSLFQKLIPPVLPFYAGSLGFLMTLSTEEFRDRIDAALIGNVRLTLRSRFCCVVFKIDRLNNNVVDRPSPMEPGTRVPLLPDEASSWPSGCIVASNTVMNEVVVDRGQSPFLTHLDLYADNRFLTKVQADGIIIATPTGSTAYSMAAGGSMVHPSVPCIVVTPICAHSLSFRPIILPANIEVRISISEGSRSRAFVSFDGRNRRELLEGECLRVMTSVFPMPTVMNEDQSADWFHSLSHCLHWNVRMVQGATSIPRISSIDKVDKKASPEK